MQYTKCKLKVMPRTELKTYTGSPELKESLPRGTMTALAKKYNLSYVFVFNVASGRAKTCIRELVDDMKNVARHDLVES